MKVIIIDDFLFVYYFHNKHIAHRNIDTLLNITVDWKEIFSHLYYSGFGNEFFVAGLIEI